jgi:hypothetical protein
MQYILHVAIVVTVQDSSATDDYPRNIVLSEKKSIPSEREVSKAAVAPYPEYQVPLFSGLALGSELYSNVMRFLRLSFTQNPRKVFQLNTAGRPTRPK